MGIIRMQTNRGIPVGALGKDHDQKNEKYRQVSHGEFFIEDNE
jgi:hypothetical protein